VVGDCFVRSGRAHAVVLVRNESPNAHVFTVRVQLGERTSPVAVETVQVTAPAGQVGQGVVDSPTPTPDGRVQCQILSIVDETGATPVAGDPLPPPPDSAPMPAQPSPGQSTGPLPTPPNQSAPAPSHT
jgi:hypothetical protein